ncbi:MAG: hypothetical protein AB1558_13850 [Thermodesulfobacteriota bacterium]
MKYSDSNPDLFDHRDAFLARAVERLGAYPSDFSSTMARIKVPEKGIAPRQAAGVLLPLLCRRSSCGDHPEIPFVFQLIKRSSRVSQPGDLSCPGGMMHPLVDRLLRSLLIHLPLPVIRGAARRFLMQKDRADRRVIGLFLVNALREAWEEIGLAPSHVRLLGPLPTYSLSRFRRTIFPLAGFVNKPGARHLSREVEKIVEIPMASFFKAESIGCYMLSTPDPSNPSLLHPLRHPCLIHPDQDGREEILWGATFHIAVRFLEIVMDYRLPEWEKGRVVCRTLDAGYLTGRAT